MIGSKVAIQAQRCTAQPAAMQRASDFPGYVFGRLSYASSASSSKGDAKPQADVEHEAEATKTAGNFFGTGAAAMFNTAKEKVASAVGLSDKKPLSDNENMGPAGHMQNKDPNARAEDEYSKLRGATKQNWEGAKGDDKPNLQYPDHGKNA